MTCFLRPFSAAKARRLANLSTVLALAWTGAPLLGQAGPPVMEMAVPPTMDVRVSAHRDGAPLEGPRTLGVTVWSSDGKQALAREIHEVLFEQGSASLSIGTRSPDLSPVLRSHPEVDIEYTIDGEVQTPRARVLVGGHSAASRAALSGSTQSGPALSGPIASASGAGTPAPGTKAFRAARVNHAVQAVALQPAGSASSAPQTEIVDGRRIHRRPFLFDVTYLGESRPLSELPRAQPRRDPSVERSGGREINPPRHGDLRDRNGRLFGTGTEKVRDPLVNRATRGAVQQAPAPLLNFDGITNVDGVLPPDTEGAVGLNRYIQVVNLSFAIYDKSGVQVLAPTNTNALWQSLPDLEACKFDNSGDAIFLYDQFADRFILTQFTSGDVVCFAIEAPGARGTEVENASFYLYQVSTARFPDYYKLGIWPDPVHNAYYMTTNSGFAGGYDVYALERDQMLQGLTASVQGFLSFDNLFLPADVDGATIPPNGTAGLFYTILDGGEPYFNPVPAQDSIELYEFAVDWNTPANSTFSQLQSLTSAQGLADFNWTVCGFFASSCLPQPGTGQRIDSASWWPMQRFVYRNFGSHQSLLGSWTVDVNGEPDLAAPRWFELRYDAARSSSWTIRQQGTYSPDDEHRFMPSAAMDGNGNIALGYSVTSTSTFPSVRYAVHEAGSALGSMSEEVELIAGTGSQTSSSGRWGDYASMEIDPSDDCTFWFTTEYVQSTGNAPWRTRVGTFRVPGCGSIRATPPAQAACTTDGSVDFVLDLLDFSTATADLGISGCPSGASCEFGTNPAPVPGQSILTVSSLGSSSEGDYTVTVGLTEPARGASSVEKDLLLALFDDVPPSPSLLSPLDEAVDVAADPVTLSWSGSSSSSYTVEVATDPFFTEIVDQKTVIGTSREVELATSTVYYWRVRANNACGDSLDSEVRSFSTEIAPGDCEIGEVPLVLWEDDLETTARGASCAPGWTCTGGTNDWVLWSNRVLSGTNAYNAEDVSDVSEWRLQSPSVALPADADSPVLRFWNYQEMKERNAGGCFNGGVLEVSTNGGSTWSSLAGGELLTDPYDGGFYPLGSTSNPLVGLEGWCGKPQDWTESIVDLSAWAGDTVRFRFRLGTDGVGAQQNEGWTLDDFAVTTCVAAPSPTIFIDGFEGGNINAWQ